MVVLDYETRNLAPVGSQIDAPSNIEEPNPSKAARRKSAQSKNPFPSPSPSDRSDDEGSGVDVDEGT